MPDNKYRVTHPNGSVEYTDRVPNGVPLSSVALIQYNAVGKVVTNLEMAARIAMAKQERLARDREADEELRDEVDDAKTSCEAELAPENERRLREAEEWQTATEGFAENAQQEVGQASSDLNSAVRANNTARRAQHNFSEGLGVGSTVAGATGNPLGVGASFLASLTSIATAVPALPTSPTPAVDPGLNAALGTQRAATNALRAVSNQPLGRLARAGGAILDGHGLIGDAQSVVSIFQGPDVHQILASAPTETLRAAYDALEGADLAFTEELFANDADELRAKIEDVLDARERAATQGELVEGAEDNVEYTKRLNRLLTGACVAGRASEARARWKDARDASKEEMDAEIEAIESEYDADGHKIGGG